LSSILRQYILNKNQKQIQEYVKNLKEEGNWSLISFVDELVPLLLMECNLKYSNFHLVKMSLFLRGWDPHYFTGLYSAFILYFSSGIDKTAGRMAIYQAIKYIADDI